MAEAPREVAAKALEILRSLKGLRGKLIQGAELIPAEIRPKPASGDPPKPLEFKKVRRILEDEWDDDVEEVLDEIDETPAAIASAGQVHRAVRARDGATVAVKVQAPGIAEAARSDLGAVTAVARLAAAVVPSLDATAVAGEARARILDEFDFEHEASLHRSIARAWRGHPFVHVATPDTRLSTQRVMVSEWIDGADLAAVLERPQAERDRVGELLARFYLGGPYRTGWVAADPHPGNWRILDDGRLAVFDFGAAGQLDRARLDLLARSYTAAAARDAAGAHGAIAELGYMPKPDQVDAGALLDAALALGAFVVDADPTRVDTGTARAALRAIDDPERDVLAILGRLTLPPADLLLRTAEIGTIGVLAQLEATAPWGAIAAEWWSGATPATELGRAEAAFWS